MKYLPLAITFALMGFFLYFAVVAFATDKFDWCHCEPNGGCQTLNLPLQALNGHKDAYGNPLHAGDHEGICEQPSPTPTCSVTPSVEPSVSPSITISPTPELTATPSATPTSPPEPKGPPEWAEPCYYMPDSEECRTRQEVFVGEGEQFGANK